MNVRSIVIVDAAIHRPTEEDRTIATIGDHTMDLATIADATKPINEVASGEVLVLIGMLPTKNRLR